MVSFTVLASLLASLSAVTATPFPPGGSGGYGNGGRKPGCGEVDVIFTGLPPYHPLVTSQGFNPAMVDKGLRGDAADIVKAGYNLRVILFGPEQPLTRLSQSLIPSSTNPHWSITGVGYGVRGSRLVNVTERFTDIVQLYREKAPQAPILFDYSPTSALWALQEYVPLAGDCSGKPGRDLGIQVYCDICGNGTTSS